jgi:hypothetical protein
MMLDVINALLFIALRAEGVLDEPSDSLGLELPMVR